MRPRWTRSRLRRACATACVALTTALAAVISAPPASAVVITVHCPQDSLQDALDAAPANATVHVTGTCHGNFRAGTNVTMVGTPTATLDGGGTGTTLLAIGFRTVRLAHLVITGGMAANGGGIFFGAGSLSLDHVTVRGNSAVGGSTPGAALGGGIQVASPSFVTITHSTIANNHVSVSGANSETAAGGGINAEGDVTIVDSVVRGNTSDASSSNNAGEAAGVGVDVFGALTLVRTTVAANHGTGQGPDFGIVRGAGVSWGPAFNDLLTITDSKIVNNLSTATSPNDATVDGGGLFVFTDQHEIAVIRGSEFAGNQATATSPTGSAKITGGAIYADGVNGAVLRVTSTQIHDTSSNARGATTAEADGGAIFMFGSGSISRTTIADNTLTIHSGTGAATGGGGGIFVRSNDPFTIASSTISGNTVDGSSDSSAVSIAGGGLTSDGFRGVTIRGSTVSGNRVASSAGNHTSEALGGGLELETNSTTPGDLVINSTITGNTINADGFSAPDATGAGIGVFDRLLDLRFVTIVRNRATGSGPSSFFGGGGLYMETGTDTHLEGTIVALNAAATGKDCIGTATSAGFNLFGSTAGCSTTLVASDRTNPAPKLGQLASNGGFTKTVALLGGSPALNRMPKAACQAIVKKDQRGVARPQGLKCDEGAFERKP